MSTFGIEYGISSEKILRAKDIVREVIQGLEGVRLDRVHSKGLGPSLLDFEVVYFILVSDYARHMDLQEQLWLETYKRFEAEKSPFAFPTQTLIMRRDKAAS